MIQRFLPPIVALGSVLCAACYPVRENPPGRPGPVARTQPAPVLPTESPKPLAPSGPLPLPAETSPQPAKPAAPASAAPPAVSPAVIEKAPAPTTQSHITANKAPGREGYVLSPFTGKLMLVRGIPSGTVVPDQTCPPSEKKFFRVP